MLAARAALVAAVRRTCPGLIDARLARIDHETWIDVWSWDSRVNAVDRARSGAIPETAAASGVTRDMSTTFADVVDERQRGCLP